MHDKSPAPANPVFPLPGQQVIAMDGRDAAAFAQAQFMNDLNGLQPGQWQWSGWLTPKGRVVALFALLKWSEQRVWLLVPDADAFALAEGLRRFLFRSKVTIEVRDDLQVTGAFEAPEAASGNAFSDDGNGGTELDMGAEGGPRCLRVVKHGPVVATRSARDRGFEARWQLFDLEHGLPRLPASQIEHWTPQQLSLERLRAFSVKKGCYPGQEIVARTHFLGKAKRGLVLLEGDAPMLPEAEVHGGDRALGSVVASADADSRHLALAVLPLGRDEAELSIDARAVRVIPIKEGLAR
ncbi:CAF17-like 4Fe-4S cluster assembly/insertion protein YgfZ [Lysobacter sp. F6437]|uniref:CAF17-like 4Fe-4S cluster assembly/insertion protein YgfZ n=1 Tax=Lysobacter sp. F6437 TaxID=3459296 RepID=UPI00403DBDA4